MNIKITGSGSYIPEIIVSNLDFTNHHFMNEDGTPFAYSNEIVIGNKLFCVVTCAACAAITSLSYTTLSCASC